MRGPEPEGAEAWRGSRAEVDEAWAARGAGVCHDGLARPTRNQSLSCGECEGVQALLLCRLQAPSGRLCLLHQEGPPQDVRISSTTMAKVVPAQLSFLAIYNPALGPSAETFHDQIVFYYSKAARARSRLEAHEARAAAELREQDNEKLRQVGLAQGMVGFARYRPRYPTDAAAAPRPRS